MIFNQDVIRRKSAALDVFFTRTLQSVIDDLVRVFGAVHDVQMINRPWYPGGGAVLFSATLGTDAVFIKIKDKTLEVEGRLECEPAFSTRMSSANEAAFCRLLADDPGVVKLKACAEDDTWTYTVFERLTPFDQAMATLNGYERYQAYCDIEALLRRLFDQGIVHGDVHEKNILFRDRQAVLCDFEEARFLTQDLLFEQSLDVLGENRYGNLGLFPDGHGQEGLTCLARLRQVFRPLIEQTLPALMSASPEPHFQSVSIGDYRYTGQRPPYDNRHGILLRLLDELAPRLGPHLHLLDAGANLGALAFSAARCPAIEKITGLDSCAQNVQMARILGFLQAQDKTGFTVNQLGVDPLPDEPVDVLLLFSVYHLIENKDAFLRALTRRRPRAIIAELAVPQRHYPQRGNLENELRHIRDQLGYSTLQLIGYTVDYGLPICLLSDLPLLSGAQRDAIMGIRSLDAHQAQPQTTPGPKKSWPLKASIVLSTHDQAQQLREALPGLLAQTCGSYELIVVDDGSTDQTAEILAGIRHPRLRVIHQTQQGQPAALNHGFGMACGEYWTWLDVEDRVESTWLQQMVQTLDDSPAEVGIALGAYRRMDQNGRISATIDKPALSACGLLLGQGHPSLLYRADLARAAGAFDPSLNRAAGLDLCLRMIRLARVAHPEPVLYTRRAAEPASCAALIDKFIATCGGKLDIDRVFPGIVQSANPALARWQARIWLSGLLLATPFCPAGAVLDLLLAALREQFEPWLVGNIVFVLAHQNAWAPATQIVSACLQKDQSVLMRTLADSVARQDLPHIRFSALPREALVFDPAAQFI